jgi:hypothetical protein
VPRELTTLQAVAAVLACEVVPLAAAEEGSFVSLVAATSPLAYYRLESRAGASQVGSTSFVSSGGVTVEPAGAPIGMPSLFARLNGRDGFIMTTQAGGAGTAGSIMAWVSVARLPSDVGHILYVAGESQAGNEFDLEFAADNALVFRTAATSPLTFAPPPSTLVGQWHMIVATFDTVRVTRALYWDGKVVAADNDPGKAGKAGAFTIGANSFGGVRFFEGGIDEVALWGRALTTAEVASLYSAAIRPSD